MVSRRNSGFALCRVELWATTIHFDPQSASAGNLQTDSRQHAYLLTDRTKLLGEPVLQSMFCSSNSAS